MKRTTLFLAIVSASVVAGMTAADITYGQTGNATNPIYDTNGTNVVPGRYYQLSLATSDFFFGYKNESSGMCSGYWIAKNDSPVQYGRFCSDLDCTNTGNRDSMIVQLNCGYLKVEGSTARMTIVKEDATWFDTVPYTAAGKQGYKLHVRSTQNYLDLASPGRAVSFSTNEAGADWIGLTPINGNPTMCNHVDADCSALKPDRMINKPVYTNTWKNAYLPTQCGSRWKASPLYHKTRILGYRSFKQDNNWDNGRLATELVDFDRFNSGNITPTTLGDNGKMKWYSDRSCYNHQSVGCSIPGLCGGGGSWAGIVVVVFAWLDRDTSGGKYCAGNQGADTMSDCCARAANEDSQMSPTYFFEQGGEVSVDNRASWFPMYYVYTNKGGQKKYMRNECDGDDIYWGNKDPSFIYFTNHSVRQGQVLIRYWTKNARGEQVVEEAQDDYVTPQESVDVSTLPKEGQIEFKEPRMKKAPAPKDGKDR